LDTIALTMKEQQRVPVIERVFRREPTMADTASRCDTNADQPLRGAHPGCVVGAPAVGDGSQEGAAEPGVGDLEAPPKVSPRKVFADDAQGKQRGAGTGRDKGDRKSEWEVRPEDNDLPERGRISPHAPAP